MHIILFLFVILTHAAINGAVEAIMGGIDEIYEKLDKKIENSKNDLSMQISLLDRKFEAQQERSLVTAS